MELLRPAFPGTLRRVRRNMHHLVLVVDPVDPDVRNLIETAEIFWANEVPLRVGKHADDMIFLRIYFFLFCNPAQIH